MSYVLERDYGERALDLIRQGDVARYLAVLLRVARVNEVSVAERNLTVPLAASLEADEPTTVVALQLADDPLLSLEALAEPILQPVIRLCLYRDAVRIALADGVIDTQEEKLLGEVARVLDLQPTLAKRIEALVRRVWDAQEDFLQLLP